MKRASPPNAMLDNTSVHVIRNRISAVRRIDPKKATMEAIKVRLKAMLTGYSFNLVTPYFERVFRARINPGITPFAHVDELWYPKPIHCTRLGRFNRIGVPAFYCSDAPQTALIEIRPKIGNYLCLMAAGPRAARMGTMSLLHFGMDRSQSPAINAMKPSLPRDNPKHRAILGTPGNSRKWRLIDDYLNELATQVVEDGDEDLYRLYIGALEILSTDNFDGLAYPSVATKLNGTNICLPPARADALLKPVSIDFMQVVGMQDGIYAAQEIGPSATIAGDGSLRW